MKRLLQKFWYHRGYSSTKKRGVKIIQNSARCLICTDSLYMSRAGRGSVTCTCGNLTISGGTKALVRYFETDLWQETSRTKKEKKDGKR